MTMAMTEPASGRRSARSGGAARGSLLFCRKLDDDESWRIETG